MTNTKKTKFEMLIIDKVKEIRLMKGYSQTNIAAVLETTPGFIGQIESSRHASKYNFNHLNKLAYEFDCSPQDFMPKKYVKETNWEK